MGIFKTKGETEKSSSTATCTANDGSEAWEHSIKFNAHMPSCPVLFTSCCISAAICVDCHTSSKEDWLTAVHSAICADLDTASALSEACLDADSHADHIIHVSHNISLGKMELLVKLVVAFGEFWIRRGSIHRVPLL